ncbi:hypothetical protein E4582_00460 [Luteimonas yindakuii]|uniref:Glycosyltransferase family 4 protein n=1 Tax=Luteimonas yindakuii TaxID=2565782 RepID=A0A4Z1R1K5_9GAMM|nr:hypothetical protein [Luteimonas yindakuii]TKS53390.1 hypothetical protein E4582_00460 [Luteimonas yindakuii]
MDQSQRRVHLQLSKTGGPPFNGSVGYVNDRIAPLLRARGWLVQAFAPPRPRLPAAQESMVPLALARALADQASGPRPLLAIHDGAGVSIRGPARQWAQHHLVLYHGLAYGTGAWIGNEAIDLHCANSPYLARTLRALFATPDWQGRRVLDPAGCTRVVNVPMPVPCVSTPAGEPGFPIGADVPVAVRRAVDAGVVVGHALQPGKQDLMATVGILYALNDIARRRGGARVMLAISEQSLPPAHQASIDAMLAGSGLRCADLFLPVPHLHQRAVFELFGLTRFGLAYNLFPEPFGFYVLESVHAGCPVYTNGVGNNRFLLPPAHGITVIEDATMVADATGQVSPAAFVPVAEAILDGIGNPGPVREACRRGRAHIDACWSPAAFEHGFLAAVERALAPPPPPVDFDALMVEVGPLVRGIDATSGVVRGDYGSRVLRQRELAIVQELVGRSAAELDVDDMQRLETEHRLFQEGVLALAVAAETTAETAGSPAGRTSGTGSIPG